MGRSQGEIVREQLEKARQAKADRRPFMRLAGAVTLDANLSMRKGFAKK